jgi:hypothetical protein
MRFISLMRPITLDRLRREAVDLPVWGVILSAIEETVVETGGAALPELDLLRDDAVAAPERGRGDLAFGELLADRT